MIVHLQFAMRHSSAHEIMDQKEVGRVSKDQDLAHFCGSFSSDI
jgi:hypothetical protein